MIRTDKLVYEYIKRDEAGNIAGAKKAVDSVTLGISPGQFIAILGHNGCGKSTFARHINALLTPTEGTVWVDGRDTSQNCNVLTVRQNAGMVFQNPDNQIIGSVVEEDVGFGPENLSVPTKDIWKRVEESLGAVGMLKYSKMSPNRLSGGQKQRVAIAGTLAMKPKCIVLDEPTAMLDPEGRKEVIAAITRLNKEEKVTIILITHYLEEISNADYVFVMNSGRIVMEGTPKDIYADTEGLVRNKLELPQSIRLGKKLYDEGIIGNRYVENVDAIVEELVKN